MQCGFTLVEILVVVAIIAIVLSIVLPGFGHVRALSNQKVCLAHMRDTGVAMGRYTMDYRMHFPPYLPEPDDAFHGGWATTFMQRGYLAQTEALLCTEAPGQKVYYEQVRREQGENHANSFISYGYNRRNIGSSYWQFGPSDAYPWGPPARVDQIQQSGRTVLFADSYRADWVAFDIMAGSSWVEDFITAGSIVEPRHFGQLSLVWVDLSAHALQIKNPDNPYEAGGGDLSHTRTPDSLWDRD